MTNIIHIIINDIYQDLKHKNTTSIVYTYGLNALMELYTIIEDKHTFNEELHTIINNICVDKDLKKEIKSAINEYIFNIYVEEEDEK